MKKINTLYWIFTILFAGFMIFTAVPDILVLPDAEKFMDALGYPAYFTPFIGWAKILGSIAILFPGFNRIKEWAYAGLFFDLIGAVYSNVATFGVNSSMLFMAIPFILGILSYVYYHKRLKETSQP
ncbi:MAG: DoxX family protein [Ginsengibacter sp.]